MISNDIMINVLIPVLDFGSLLSLKLLNRYWYDFSKSEIYRNLIKKKLYAGVDMVTKIISSSLLFKYKLYSDNHRYSFSTYIDQDTTEYVTRDPIDVIVVKDINNEISMIYNWDHSHLSNIIIKCKIMKYSVHLDFVDSDVTIISKYINTYRSVLKRTPNYRWFILDVRDIVYFTAVQIDL